MTRHSKFTPVLALLSLCFATACGDVTTGPRIGSPSASVGATATAPCTVLLAPVPGGNSQVKPPWTATGACARYVEIQAYPNAGYTFSHWTLYGDVSGPLPAVYANPYFFQINETITFHPVFTGTPTPPPTTCNLVAGDSTLVADEQNTNVSLIGTGCAGVLVYGIGAFNWGPYTGGTNGVYSWPLQRRPAKRGLQAGSYRVVANITATVRDTALVTSQ
jgi:hypothetical protein